MFRPNKLRRAIRGALITTGIAGLTIVQPALAVPTTSMLGGGIVINEILIDPNSSSRNFDTDGNGSASTTDEFVELLNIGSSSINIGGYQLWDAGNTNWFSFPTATSLAPGASAAVIVGTQSGGSAPTLPADNFFFDAGRGGGVLNNGGDNVVLYDPTNDNYVQLVYNNDAADTPTTSYSGFSATATRIGNIENWGSDRDGTSLVRDSVNDVAGSTTIVRHEDIFGGELASPAEGTRSTSTTTALSIPEIQGAAHVSPHVGTTVETSGIVTAVDSNGFYVQDPNGDGDAATSDGIFVFTASTPNVAVGDAVEITGDVSEFTPGGTATRNLSTTQLSNPNVNVVSSGNTLPDAVQIGAAGLTPPDRTIEDDNFTSFDPSADGADFYESLEGMRVTVESPTAIAPTNRFGEIFTAADGTDTNSTNGGLVIAADDFNPEKIQIDEDTGILPGFEMPEVDTGAKLDPVTGVVGYGFGNYEIYPTEAFGVTPSSIRPEVSTIQSGDDTLTVASYNTLNLDPNDTDGDTDIANDRFNAIARQIVGNLRNPDIIGLQEIQDNSGSLGDGTTSAGETLQRLIDAIAAAGGPTYSYIDNTSITDDANGGQPGGNIRNAFLYNADRVGVEAGSVQSIQDGDQATDPDNPFYDSRLPLAATFIFNGEKITVVNNHLSSKGGSAPIMGTEQPFEGRQDDPDVNGSVDERLDQAIAILRFVEQVMLDPDAEVLLLGDFNEFEFNAPLLTLETLLENLTLTLDEKDRYSFIFQGNSQMLDHMLVSDGLFGILSDFDVVHVNADFAETPMRASDHDPLLASFNFGAAGQVPLPATLALIALGLLMMRRR